VLIFLLVCFWDARCWLSLQIRQHALVDVHHTYGGQRMAVFFTHSYTIANCGYFLFPHNSPQSLLFLIAAEYTLNGPSRQFTYSRSVEREVFCNESIFVWERAPKDTDIIRLRSWILATIWTSMIENGKRKSRHREGETNTQSDWTSFAPPPSKMVVSKTPRNHFGVHVTAQT